MRIPDYKKRAAKAAENWSLLQAQKNLESEELKENVFAVSEIKDQSIEQTVVELIDDLAIPRTTVKGIHIVKNQNDKKEELRDIA